MLSRALLLTLLNCWTSSVFTHSLQSHDNLITAFQWNLLDFEFPTFNDEQEAAVNGNQVRGNAIPIDVAPFYNFRGELKVFTTIPRFQTGVPFSLATVTESRGNAGPKLRPYPSYEWHKSHGANCDAITSAFRVAINECNQMWVIDSGVIGSTQHCPPQLLLFDLNTDRLLHRYRFPATVYTPIASLFITPIVQVRDPPPRGRCQRSMVYVADVNFHGLVVYDQERNEAWRIENKFMYPDPNYGTHTVAGDSFDLMDGIFSMSADKRNLYFHPLASASEFAVSLDVINNQNNWAQAVDAMPQVFRQLGTRDSPCAAEAMDGRDNLYCVTLNPIRLVSWNTKRTFAARNFRVISTNRNNLQFVSGMKVVKSPSGSEELWLLSNRFQKIASGTQNPNEVNFRILKFNLDVLQNGIDRQNPNNDLHDRLIFT